MYIPKVSVLMPVYNGEKYIKEAIDSILNQTFSDFEFIIINDCSTDHSEEIIESYNDNRIRILHNKENLGIAGSLNHGLVNSLGEYVARMDADDIALEDRLETQIAFLEKNPHISLCGSQINLIDEKGNFIVRNEYPTTPDQVKSDLLFYCCICHPTVFFRKADFISNDLLYDNSFLNTEDYELWNRAKNKLQLANLPVVLLQYRKHKQNVTKTKMVAGIKNHAKVMEKNFVEMGLHFTQHQLDILSPYTFDFNVFNYIRIIKETELLTKQIFAANKKRQIFSGEALKNTLDSKIYWKKHRIRFALVLVIKTSAGFFEKINVKRLNVICRNVSRYIEMRGLRTFLRMLQRRYR